MSTQKLASIGRHLGAWLVTLYGLLTAVSVAPHLPVAVETVLVSFGPGMTLLQHYLADPSTGSSTTSTPVEAKQTAPVPVQLVQQFPVPPVVLAPLQAPTTPVVAQVPPTGPNPAPPSP